MSLGRKGPGLLARDLAKGNDPQVAKIVAVIAFVRPDILLLNDFDYDFGAVALGLFTRQLALMGVNYPYHFAPRPNSGMASGLDLDSDGRLGGPSDAQGFGWFSGWRGMAVLSRFPIDTVNARDFSALLWRDLPGAELPTKNGAAFPSVQAQAAQRLSSKGHWDVPVILPGGKVLHVLASHATPPVFDGDEDRNGLRNRDEIRFWSLYLDGQALGGYPARADEGFVILGDMNADPFDGEGAHAAIKGLLHHPLVRDVRPASAGAVLAAKKQGGGNADQRGPSALDTVDWDESRTTGNMRVDYVLPGAGLVVTGAGVFWPAPGEDGPDLSGPDGVVGSRHHLVWVDVQ